MAVDSPVYVGTCGFSYPEWIEAGIYPPGTKSARMLELYRNLFPVVELNYTWYQMVRTETMERMLAGDGAGLLYCAKLTRTMTHEVEDNWRSQAELYRHGIQPLLTSGRLLSVLVQLPPFFHRTTKNRSYLASLLDALQPLPLAVEFRHHSWAQDSVFKGLEQRRITLVSVDAPSLPYLFPSLDVVTNPELFYLRLHGRNSRGWRSRSKQQQFNYDYTEEDLAQWSRDRVPRMRKACNTGVILFNNHVAGQAVRNARTMARMIS
ncbi:DUF72 domain-containing protein [Desulfobulbus oligotrophicus]|uniref:DUF72 domain-containing protein n=1 Tax=Desulfobulbus oligotrophicus TaxID=1909699 RepID=A0A7T5VB55_9BACT|nr:DUF72 domain-containing protein [Desulfobulbus oligotrophicus]QQG64622.1 DUF72 domain-containing protein [Desulfobulbus oligotrophicus]